MQATASFPVYAELQKLEQIRADTNNSNFVQTPNTNDGLQCVGVSGVLFTQESNKLGC